MATVLEVSNLSKSFGPTTVLHSINLTLARGEVRALVGENGSGKSTLIKILSGYHEPDPGSTVRVNGNELQFGNARASASQGLCFVHQNLGLVESASVLENLFMTRGFPTRFGLIHRRQARREASEMLRKVNLELDVEMKVSDLSPAVKTGVALARVLRSSPSDKTTVLVLDEPTATLPAHEVDQLLGIVRSVAATGVAVIYVSHRLEEIFQVSDSVTIIRDGKEVLTTETSTLTNQSLLTYLLGKELEALQHHASQDIQRKTMPPLLEVLGLVSSRLNNLSLSVGSGEIVGIAGLTGSGREEFCGVVFGANEREAGEVRVGGVSVVPGRPDRAIAAGACFVSADRSRDGGFPELSARENLSITQVASYWHFPFIHRREEKAATKQWYERLQVRPRDAFEELFVRFSGGNQQKIIMGRWLQRNPKVFLLDEPTQGVDVGTKSFIHQLLIDAAAQGAAVVVSSADHEELASICDRVVIMRRGQVMRMLWGGEVTTHNISHGCLDATRDEATT